MASGDEEELVAAAAFGHEKATSARRIRRGLSRDWETERVSKRVANSYSWVGGRAREA
jgi:hypothetical protein